MSSGQFKPVVRYIHKLAAAQRDEFSDRDLLDRFLRANDQDAFAAIVHRYGGLVFSVCRRIVQDWQCAEDCFQAVFLILASRGIGIRKSDSLSSWLYGMATRVASKARTQAIKRRARERGAATPIAREQSNDFEWRELKPHLDDAVARLASNYRIPFVLCYVQGLSIAQIARQLDQPRGTVAAKLARARRHLQARLARRGIALTATGLVLALSDSTRAAATPALTASTISIASLIAAGKAASAIGISSQTASLAKGVIRSMFMTKLTALIGTLALVLSGTVAIGYKTATSELPSDPGQERTSKVAPAPQGAVETISYQLAFEIKDIDADGNETLLATPTLKTLKKEEGRIEIATSTKNQNGETIPIKLRCSGTVEPLANGQAHLRLLVERLQKQAEENQETTTRGVSTQLEKTIYLGDTITFQLTSQAKEQSTTRVRVKTGSARTITVPFAELPGGKAAVRP